MTITNAEFLPKKQGSEPYIKLDRYTQKNHTVLLSHTMYKNSFKCLKQLNARSENIKLLEENIGRIISDINHSNFFLDLSPNTKEIKAKINEWDLNLKASAQKRDKG